MTNKSSGKVLTVFIVIIAILLISLTAISIFFFQKELERRKSVELILEKIKANEQKLEGELKVVRKEKFLLEEKNKEADERMNNLMDELDLQSGLREEVKKENVALKEQLSKETQTREALQKKFEDGGAFEQQIADLKAKLAAETNLRNQLEQQNKDLQEKSASLEQSLGKEFSSAPKPSKEIKDAQKKVDLEKIVVVPNETPEGRILSVDTDTEFVIVNLGQKDGVNVGNIMSVYRGKEYLGDVKITRVQPEMSAADLIPPFSSRLVRKNDQVVSAQQ